MVDRWEALHRAWPPLARQPPGPLLSRSRHPNGLRPDGHRRRVLPLDGAAVFRCWRAGRCRMARGLGRTSRGALPPHPATLSRKAHPGAGPRRATPPVMNRPRVPSSQRSTTTTWGHSVPPNACRCSAGSLGRGDNRFGPEAVPFLFPLAAGCEDQLGERALLEGKNADRPQVRLAVPAQELEVAL